VSDNERRPKKGDEDYIKRPENAFILFRRKCCEDRQIAMDEASDDSSVSAPVKKQRQADLSKTISQQWKSLSQEERQKWEDLAKEKKREHEQLYPNYVYRPQRVKKTKKGKGKRAEGEGEGEEGISFVVPVPSPPRSLSRDAPLEQSRGHSRRAISAPTPPPAYQTIQLPTVNFPPRPSCPSSPTHVPSISLSRRASYIPPPTAVDPSTHYEYLPHDTVLPPTMQRPNFDTTFSYDFQNYQFESQFSRNTGVPPLQAISIPPHQTSYMGSQLVSPAESIASSLFSPTDSIASSLSPSSANAPYTPAESLSMSALSLGSRSSISMGCVPENPSAEAQEPEYGYAGSTSWSPNSLWPDPTEVLIPGDFDLASIPPIEIGTTMPEPVSGCEVEQPYGPVEEPEYNDAAPGHDPFASLFNFDHMNW